MKAFDSDVLSDILKGRADYWLRLASIPLLQQSAPVIVVEEIMRGRLDAIRQAQAGRGRVTITFAYQLFEQTFCDLRVQKLLSYNDSADQVFLDWKKQGKCVRNQIQPLSLGIIVKRFLTRMALPHMLQ